MNKNMLKLLARLSFEDVDVLYEILNELAVNLNIPDYKSQLLMGFYQIVKVLSMMYGYN